MKPRCWTARVICSPGRFPGSGLIHRTLGDMIHVGRGEVDGVMVGCLDRIAGMVDSDGRRFRFEVQQQGRPV